MRPKITKGSLFKGFEDLSFLGTWRYLNRMKSTSRTCHAWPSWHDLIPKPLTESEMIPVLKAIGLGWRRYLPKAKTDCQQASREAGRIPEAGLKMRSPIKLRLLCEPSMMRTGVDPILFSQAKKKCWKCPHREHFLKNTALEPTVPSISCCPREEEGKRKEGKKGEKKGTETEERRDWGRGRGRGGTL